MVENQSWNRLIFPKWLQPLHIASKKTCVFAFYEKCIKKWNDFPMFFWQFSNMFWAMCDLTLQKPSLKWWFFQSKHFCHFFQMFFHGPRAWISFVNNDIVRWPWKNTSEKSQKHFTGKNHHFNEGFCRVESHIAQKMFENCDKNIGKSLHF